jgi:hypothetical protein
MPREEIETFLNAVPEKFADPLTGIRAATERELSAVLAVKHQFRALRWSAIPLWRGLAKDPTVDASSIIGADDYVLCEYPLFAESQKHVDRWGGMTPDLVFLGTDRKRVTLVECKVDSRFTHGDKPPHGQLSRYLEFLCELSSMNRNLLVICPDCNREWYAKRLTEAAECAASSTVGTFIATWESVFQAI